MILVACERRQASREEEGGLFKAKAMNEVWTLDARGRRRGLPSSSPEDQEGLLKAKAVKDLFV